MSARPGTREEGGGDGGGSGAPDGDSVGGSPVSPRRPGGLLAGLRGALGGGVSTARTPRRAALALLALAVVGGGGAWWLVGTLDGDSGTPVVEARTGDLVVGVEIEGVLASRDSSMLTPPPVERFYDFKITFMAPEGEEVPAGTPILGFDTSELERRLRDRAAEAEQAAKNIEKLEADRAQDIMGRELELAEAEAELARARLLVDVPEDLAAARELAVARLDVEAAELRVGSLREQLEAAVAAWDARAAVLQAQRQRAGRQVREMEAAIESMTVEAPRSGTVIHVSDWRGEKKRVGDSAWRHEEVIELPDLSRMMGQGTVDEADARRVGVGQPFRIRLDAHPDVEYEGTVEAIWRTVQRRTVGGVTRKLIRLDLAFDRTDTLRMRPGMRFRGVVETQRRETVVVVPIHCVFPTADGAVVYRQTLLGFEEVAVELGLRNDSAVEVLAGVRPGDRLAERRPGS